MQADDKSNNPIKPKPGQTEGLSSNLPRLQSPQSSASQKFRHLAVRRSMFMKRSGWTASTRFTCGERAPQFIKTEPEKLDGKN